VAGDSEFQSRSDFQNMEAPESPLPPVANHLVGRFEKHTDIPLLFFAREKACPVLVQFSAGPSKAAEARLRQAAKSRSLKLRFSRLIDRLAIVEVSPPLSSEELDSNVLRSLGVRW
jgi:hypothetical protein